MTFNVRIVCNSILSPESNYWFKHIKNINGKVGCFGLDIFVQVQDLVNTNYLVFDRF